jgi:DNA-binding response OmpR family regulator
MRPTPRLGRLLPLPDSLQIAAYFGNYYVCSPSCPLMPRVLVVDDEPAVRRALERALKLDSYDVELAADGEEALDRLVQSDIDAVVLDIAMPRLDGLEVCRRMRTAGDRTPVLMLTARDAIDDRVEGLDVGADDYLVKPFAMNELVARLRALLRRAAAHHADGTSGVEPPVRLGQLLVDAAGGVASWDGRDLGLTRRELTLLDVLARNSQVVLSRDRLLELVWGYDFAPDSRALDVFVSYVRRKLETAGAPRILETVRGVGFVLRRP